jgi:hypothetical protein
LANEQLAIISTSTISSASITLLIAVAGLILVVYGAISVIGPDRRQKPVRRQRVPFAVDSVDQRPVERAAPTLQVGFHFVFGCERGTGLPASVTR